MNGKLNYPNFTKKKNYLLKTRKGSTGLFIVFIIISIVAIFIFAFATPMLMSINVDLYRGGEQILNSIDLSTIKDVPIKNQLNETLTTAKASIPDTIDILGFFYQYAWAIIIMVVGFVIFMWSRQQVETEMQIR